MIIAAQLLGALIGTFFFANLIGVTYPESVTDASAKHDLLMAQMPMLCPGNFQAMKQTVAGDTVVDLCDGSGYYIHVLIAEIVGGFMFIGLILCIKYTNTANDLIINGLGVSMCLYAMVTCLGGISGACLNPAVGVAQTAYQTMMVHNIGAKKTSMVGVFYYVLGPMMGGFLAGVFSLLRKGSLDSLASAT